MSKIRLDVDAHGRGEIVVDGVDLSTVVSSVAVTADARSRPVVTLTLPALAGLRHAADDADVRLPDDVHAALVRLGWTPPERQR